MYLLGKYDFPQDRTNPYIGIVMVLQFFIFSVKLT